MSSALGHWELVLFFFCSTSCCSESGLLKLVALFGPLTGLICLHSPLHTIQSAAWCKMGFLKHWIKIHPCNSDFRTKQVLERHGCIKTWDLNRFRRLKKISKAASLVIVYELKNILISTEESPNYAVCDPRGHSVVL